MKLARGQEIVHHATHFSEQIDRIAREGIALNLDMTISSQQSAAARRQRADLLPLSSIIGRKISANLVSPLPNMGIGLCNC